MTWTKALMVVVFAFSGASVWACGGDDSSGVKSASSTCGPDDPSTPNVDESECKALANATDGHTAVVNRGCQQCHGQDMAGQTDPLSSKPEYLKNIQGQDLKLYPPNLTNDNDTGIGTWKDDALALAIRDGVDKDGQHLCPQMNHYPNMSDYEVYSIVMYLRSIPPVSKKVPDSICPPEKPGPTQ